MSSTEWGAGEGGSVQRLPGLQMPLSSSVSLIIATLTCSLTYPFLFLSTSHLVLLTSSCPRSPVNIRAKHYNWKASTMALDPHPQLSFSEHRFPKEAPRPVFHLLAGDHHHMCHLTQVTPSSKTRKTRKTQSLAAPTRHTSKRDYFEQVFSLRPTLEQDHTTTIITAKLKTNLIVRSLHSIQSATKVH